MISVFESRTMKLHTTRSWDFLGLPIPSYTNNRSARFSLHLPSYGDHDVVVAIFDSGVLWLIFEIVKISLLLCLKPP